MKDQSKTIHEVGSVFNVEKYLRARLLTINAVREVASKVTKGITEEIGQNLIEEVLTSYGVYFRGSLASTDIKPKENLWILEIHIRHPKKEFGAFYEDLISTSV